MVRSAIPPASARFAVRLLVVPVTMAILMCALGAAGGARAAEPARGAAPAASLDSLLTPAQRDTLQRLRDLLKGGAFAEVEPGARALLADVGKLHGEESLQAALVLDVLVQAMRRGGRAGDPKTRELAERAVQTKEKHLGRDHSEVAKSLNSLATLHWVTGDLAGAQPLYERALVIWEKVLGPDHPNVAGILGNLAALHSAMGDYAGSRPLHERALAIREKTLGPDHPDVAQSLNNLAILLKSTGDYAGARPLYERALAIREKSLGPDHPEVAQALNNLGLLLKETGDYAGARPVYERALAIWEKTLGPDHPDVGATLDNMATLLRDTGDPAGARAHYERAIAIREKAMGPDHPAVATSLDNLASLLATTGDFAGARPLCERALAIREKALGADHPDVAISLNNLAGVLKDTGDLAGARPLYERALAIWEKALGPDHLDLAETLNNLASLSRAGGDPAGARSRYERALTIQEKTLGPDHPAVAATLSNLSGLLWSVGDARTAAERALRAETIGREHFRATARVLPERQALAFAASRPSGLAVVLSIQAEAKAPETKREAIDAQVRSRALVLDEMAARHRSLRGLTDPEVAPLMADYRAASTRYATLLARGPDAAHPELYRPLLDQTREQRERSERALSEKSMAFRLEQRERTIGLSEVVAALPRGSALLAFASYHRLEAGQRGEGDAAYLAYVLRGGTDSIAVVPLGAARVVDSLVARWSEEAGQGVVKHLPEYGESAYRRAGAALREEVWDPVLPYLRGSERVFVVPDGALNLVNLGTLPLADGSYLVEKGPLLHTLSAERDLVTLEGPGETGRGILAMGGAAYDEIPDVVLASAGNKGKGEAQLAAVRGPGAYRGARSGCSEFVARDFAPLPETLREVNEIGQLWRAKPKRQASPTASARGGAGPVLELSGAQASERAFKLGAPGHAVLHLATHGFFITGRCRSAVDAGTRGLVGVAGETSPRPLEITDENPLVLSGLALAGANHRREARPEEEDGILTAEEIAALDLGGVEWAVLSACETGVGDVRAGEGVFGLRRAFQVAGARTLIMSLWAVEDQATRGWMRELYRGRHERGLGTAEAVREASLAVLRERRAKKLSTHPFYWGAFVAAGDWR